MPRMNLTDEEAEVVERFRLKNLEVTAFNAGLDRARELIRGWYNSSEANITTLEKSIQTERKQVRL